MVWLAAPSTGDHSPVAARRALALGAATAAAAAVRLPTLMPPAVYAALAGSGGGGGRCDAVNGDRTLPPEDLFCFLAGLPTRTPSPRPSTDATAGLARVAAAAAAAVSSAAAAADEPLTLAEVLASAAVARQFVRFW